jgi:polyvinyl alcohol dehydrogenase (cytochrome)
VTSGGWAAVDAATGKVLWTTGDPQGSRAEGPVSLANGVLFGCNMNGTMFALNAKTGAQLWMQQADLLPPYFLPPPCIAGAAVSNGMVFWGSGDGRGSIAGYLTHPYKLYAFGL